MENLGLDANEIGQFRSKGYLGPYPLCSVDEMGQVLEQIETAAVHQTGHDADAQHALHVPICLQFLTGIGDAKPLASEDTLAFAPDRAVLFSFLPHAKRPESIIPFFFKLPA